MLCGRVLEIIVLKDYYVIEMTLHCDWRMQKMASGPRRLWTTSVQLSFVPMLWAKVSIALQCKVTLSALRSDLISFNHNMYPV